MKLLLFIYGWIFYNNAFMVTMLVSDAFWTNLPVLITSMVTAFLSAAAYIATLKGNKKVAEVAKGVDGVVEKLLESKDATVKEIKESQKLIDVKAAAFNEGKLSELGKSTKEDIVPKQIVEEQIVEKQIKPPPNK